MRETSPGAYRVIPVPKWPSVRFPFSDDIVAFETANELSVVNRPSSVVCATFVHEELDELAIRSDYAYPRLNRIHHYTDSLESDRTVYS